jgi:hypothetical protein
MGSEIQSAECTGHGVREEGVAVQRAERIGLAVDVRACGGLVGGHGSLAGRLMPVLAVLPLLALLPRACAPVNCCSGMKWQQPRPDRSCR